MAPDLRLVKRRSRAVVSPDVRFHALVGILGSAAFLILPPLLGVIDVRTVFIAFAVGSVPILPFWRHVGAGTRQEAISVAVMFITFLIVVRTYSWIEGIVCISAQAFTVSVLRYFIGQPELASRLDAGPIGGKPEDRNDSVGP